MVLPIWWQGALFLVLCKARADEHAILPSTMTEATAWLSLFRRVLAVTTTYDKTGHKRGTKLCGLVQGRHKRRHPLRPQGGNYVCHKQHDLAFTAAMQTMNGAVGGSYGRTEARTHSNRNHNTGGDAKAHKRLTKSRSRVPMRRLLTT